MEVAKSCGGCQSQALAAPFSGWMCSSGSLFRGKDQPLVPALPAVAPSHFPIPTTSGPAGKGQEEAAAGTLRDLVPSMLS